MGIFRLPVDSKSVFKYFSNSTKTRTHCFGSMRVYRGLQIMGKHLMQKIITEKCILSRIHSQRYSIRGGKLQSSMLKLTIQVIWDFYASLSKSHYNTLVKWFKIFKSTVTCVPTPK